MANPPVLFVLEVLKSEAYRKRVNIKTVAL